jgi:ADP-ribosyl-[dinitrogen reductase] hydrolase
MINRVEDALLGIAVGDALGVPHEFSRRSVLKQNPVTDMDAFGTHRVPKGVWSDDTSLSLCLAESLLYGFNINDIARNFISWLYYNHWTATGTVFDVGIATRNSIDRLKEGVSPLISGGLFEYTNGNGSLMRILPLIFFIKDKPIADRYEYVKQVSAITHGHIRSVIACFYYTEFALQLLKGVPALEAYNNNKTAVLSFLTELGINPDEIAFFNRLLNDDIYLLEEKDISSSGYVVHTLEAAMWCLLTSSTYQETVLKAVNLGEDTDTTAAVVGGLAGLLYTADNIPANWLTVLAKKEEITALAQELNQVYG